MKGLGWAAAITAMIFGALAITSMAIHIGDLALSGGIARWIDPFRAFVSGPLTALIHSVIPGAPQWAGDFLIIHMLMGASAYRYVTLVYRFKDNALVLAAFMLAGWFVMAGLVFGGRYVERTRRDLWVFAAQPKYAGRYNLDWATFQRELGLYKSAIWMEALVFIAPAIALGALILSINGLLAGGF